MDTLDKQPTEAEKRAREGTETFLRAQRMAAEGVVACRKCGKQEPTEKQITIGFERALVLSVCPACLVDHDVVIGRGIEGIRVQIRPRNQIISGVR